MFLATRTPRLALVALGMGLLSPAPAQATPELDRQYALERIGFLHSWDNVDGLFGDYIASAYKDYFSKQSRFVLQDLSKADPILEHSKIPYRKLIEDKAILGQLTRSTKSQSIMRTLVQKEGPQYRFSLDWLHSPKMEVIARDSFVMQEPTDGRSFGAEDIRAQLADALDRMIAKLPFVATVTGRDNGSITIDVGANASVSPGDTLIIGTLDEVRNHPLLDEIVDWRLTPTGRAEVESLDERIAFAQVTQEEPNHSIARYQKVVRILPKPHQEQPLLVQEESQSRNRDTPPTLGWVSGGLWMGSVSRNYSSDAGIGRAGSGLLFGAKADGELWFNRDIFANMGFGYGFFNYSQKDTNTQQSTPASSVSGSISSFNLDVGYNYLVTGDFFGPKGWAKLGYHSVSYSFPVGVPAGGSVEYTAPLSFHSLYLGIGGDLPIRESYGVMLNLNFGVLSGAGESTSLMGEASGVSDVSFYMGGYYRYSQRVTIRVGLDITANGADGNDPTLGHSSASQKIISIVPALVYYF